MSKIPVAEFRATIAKEVKPAAYATRMSDSKRYHGQFLLQCKAHKLPEPIQEYRFAPPRRWRFDFCWVGNARDFGSNNLIAMEIEGGLFIKGGHSRGRSFIKNMEKYNQATLLGWRVFRFSPDEIKDGSAIAFMKKVFIL
jgi:hypothetical protein